MKARNLIDTELWLAARWRDTSFLLTPDLDHPAGIGLMFEDYSAAQRIFAGWRETLGETDTAEVLRVCIIHGTAPTGEKGYTVHFTTEPMSVISLTERQPQEFLIGSRFHFKETLSNQNFEWFVASYERHGRYFVFPLPMQQPQDFDACLSHRLWKTKFHHRDFATVTPNDIDAVAMPH